MRSSRPRIVVVGAGIVGASVAYHLARRNAPVMLVDKGQPAGEATSKAFAWINVSHGLPEPYSQLRHHAIQEYRRLEAELKGKLRIDWSGALTWSENAADTERFARENAASGNDVRLIGRREIAALEPNLKQLPDCAAFAAAEGAVEPTETTNLLVRAAREAGAVISLDMEVLGLTAKENRITGIATREGRIDADIVVLAAGVRTGILCRPLGLTIPINSSPSILLRFRSKGQLVHRVISNPILEIRSLSDTVMLGAEDYVDDSTENGPGAVAQRALAEIRQHLVGGDAVELEDVSVGMRPMPDDGLPIIGYVPEIEGLYVTVMHAGVTLAPTVGRFASTEILDGVEVKLLAPCRGHRFMN